MFGIRLNKPVESTIEIPEKKLLESNSKYQERVKKAIKPLAMATVQWNHFLKYIEQEKAKIEQQKKNY